MQRCQTTNRLNEASGPVWITGLRVVCSCLRRGLTSLQAIVPSRLRGLRDSRRRARFGRSSVGLIGCFVVASAAGAIGGDVHFTSSPNVQMIQGGYIGTNDGNDAFGEDAGMVCDSINTLGHAGNAFVDEIAVSVQMTTNWVGDLTLKLRSPNGVILTLLSRPGFAEPGDNGGGGGGNDANLDGVPIRFVDGAPGAEGMGGVLTTDQAVCTDDGNCEFSPFPDTAGGPSTFASAYVPFATPNGLWTLCVGDAEPGIEDMGTLLAWDLELYSRARLSDDPMQPIPQGQYIGIGDGNDGFGVDAGMVCSELDYTGIAGAALTDGHEPPGGAFLPQLNLTATHNFVGDLVVKLRSPGGQILSVVSRPGFAEGVDDGSGAGGHASNLDGLADIGFFNEATFATAEQMGEGLEAFEAVCTDDGICAFLPFPDSGPGTDFSDFVDGLAAGVWTLCLGDAYEDDSGDFLSWNFAFDTFGVNPDVILFSNFESGDLAEWNLAVP